MIHNAQLVPIILHSDGFHFFVSWFYYFYPIQFYLVLSITDIPIPLFIHSFIDLNFTIYF